MTDPKPDARELARRVRDDLDGYGKQGEEVWLTLSELRVLSNAVLDSSGDRAASEALRRLRKEMQDAWLACIESKKLFSVGTADRRECQAEANAFQSVCFAIDRELAALASPAPRPTDTPPPTATEAEGIAKTTLPPAPPEVATGPAPGSTPGAGTLSTPCASTNDSSASSDSMTTSDNPSPAGAAPAAPSDTTGTLTTTEPPAREPGGDEIEAWRIRATAGQADDHDIERGLAIMRRLRDERDEARRERDDYCKVMACSRCGGEGMASYGGIQPERQYPLRAGARSRCPHPTPRARRGQENRKTESG